MGVRGRNGVSLHGGDGARDAREADAHGGWARIGHWSACEGG